MSTEAKKIYRVKIAPAEGVEKRTLEQDCARLIEASAFTPEAFRDLSINMVNLLGTNNENIWKKDGDKESGNAESNFLIDRENRRAINYHWSVGDDVRVSMWSRPEWYAWSEREQEMILPTLSEPYTIEHISFLYTYTESISRAVTFQPTSFMHGCMSRHLHYPEGYGPSIASYFKEGSCKPLSGNSEPLEREEILPHSVLRDIGHKVFTAWMKR